MILFHILCIFFHEAMMLLAKWNPNETILHGLKGLPYRITWAKKPWILRWHCWRRGFCDLCTPRELTRSPNLHRKKKGRWTPWTRLDALRSLYHGHGRLSFWWWFPTARGTGFVTGDVIEYVPKAMFMFLGLTGWVYAEMRMSARAFSIERWHLWRILPLVGMATQFCLVRFFRSGFGLMKTQ